MANKTYSELIEDARQKVDWARTSPALSGTERLLADSLSSLIKALDYVEQRAVNHVLGN